MDSSFVAAGVMAAGAFGIVQSLVNLIKIGAPAWPSWAYILLAAVLSPLVLWFAMMAGLAAGAVIVWDQRTLGLFGLAAILTLLGAMGGQQAAVKSQEKRNEAGLPGSAP